MERLEFAPATAHPASFAAAAVDHDGSYWPRHALQAFTLRMASHGLCVSSSMMLGDRCYALEQLAHAHALADDELRGLAMELFRHFERRQSGLPHLS